MADIPSIKKKIGSFLAREEGKMSKEKLLKVGAFIGTIAIGSALAVQNSEAIAHSNSVSPVNVFGHLATGTHTHHASHSSY